MTRPGFCITSHGSPGESTAFQGITTMPNEEKELRIAAQSGETVSTAAESPQLAGDVSPQTPTSDARKQIRRYARKISKRLLVLIILGYISIPLLMIYLVAGIYDVVRHQRNLRAVAHQYFLQNGSLTWFFSPLNLLIDLLCLPFVNKKIYKLEDLPAQYHDEIREVTEGCPAADIIAEVKRRRSADERTLLIYKWYGVNNPVLTNNYFQKDYKYVLTVGVSTFRKQTKTDRHFGWLRAGIRVLYIIDPVDDQGAFIVVNGVRHTWSTDGPLFIFDDTVMHQSFNLTDADRHGLFIDVVRPSYVPFLIKGVVRLLGVISTRLPYVRRSSNWRLI